MHILLSSECRFFDCEIYRVCCVFLGVTGVAEGWDGWSLAAGAFGELREGEGEGFVHREKDCGGR